MQNNTILCGLSLRQKSFRDFSFITLHLKLNIVLCVYKVIKGEENMIITKEMLKEINVKEELESVNFIKIKDGRHTITKLSSGKIVVTEHFGISVLPNNKIPKYIKRKLA